MASLLSISLLLLLASSVSYSSRESRKELKGRGVPKEISQHSQDNRVNPAQVLQLSWEPRVFLYRDFLSHEECDHLISLNAQGKILGLDDYSWSDSKSRQLASLGDQLKDDIVARIEERISAWSFLPKENSEPLQVVHYGVEEAEENLNYFDNKSGPERSESLMAVVIMYLSEVTQGGEILFPNSGVKSKRWSDSDCKKASKILKPTKGNAILFFTRHFNTTQDKTSSHARCPVLKGSMWSATKLIRLTASNKQSVPDGSSDSNGCTDEDENCPQWAAKGECERNPVYMIGSPDYYGTCRKSCNSC